jgi:isopenicillin-N epimerase
MSPKGSALLYVRGELQHLVEPLVVSWGWESDDPGPSRFVDEQEWTGTRDPSAYLAVPAAIDFFEEHQWPKVRVRCRKLLTEARERLLDIVGLPPLCHLDPWLAQMCAIPLPPGTDRAAFGKVLREKHAVEVPITWFDDRPWLRFSIQGYNTDEDVERLVAAVKSEVASVRRLD